MSTPPEIDSFQAEERQKLIIRRALDEIGSLDLEDKARQGGFVCLDMGHGKRKLMIQSFGQSIEIAMPSGEMKVAPGIDSLTMRVLALRYIKLSCGVPVSGEWVAYRDLPGGRFYAASLVPTIEKPLAEAFGRRRGRLGEAASEYNGEAAPYGDESYVLHPFPNTPLLLVLHWGDEEFEPDCRVLFDRCCSHYLNTDDLKILATQLASFLLRKAGGGELFENLLWMVE